MACRTSSKKDHTAFRRRSFLAGGISLSLIGGTSATTALCLQSSNFEDDEITLFATALRRVMGFTSNDQAKTVSSLVALRAQEKGRPPVLIYCNGYYLTKIQAYELLLAV